MATTTATGLPIPTSGDAPNIPADVGINLGGALDKVTVPLFASTAARDTAYASAPFGLCFVGASVDAATLYRRNAGTWETIGGRGAVVTNALTAAAGWTITDQTTLKSGGAAYFTFGATYGGAGFATNAAGYLADVTVATFAAAWAPFAMSRNPQVNAWGNSQEPWTANVSTANRSVSLVGGIPNNTVASGATFVFSGSYPLAS